MILPTVPNQNMKVLSLVTKVYSETNLLRFRYTKLTTNVDHIPTRQHTPDTPLPIPPNRTSPHHSSRNSPTYRHRTPTAVLGVAVFRSMPTTAGIVGHYGAVARRSTVPRRVAPTRRVWMMDLERVPPRVWRRGCRKDNWMVQRIRMEIKTV